MKMKIKIGSLHWEAGTFQKGEIVEVSPEQFALFEKKDVEAVPEETVQEAKQEVKVEDAQTEPGPETAEPVEVKPDSA